MSRINNRILGFLFAVISLMTVTNAYAGYSSDFTYYEWSTTAPNNRGMVIYNAPGMDNNIFLHYKVVGGVGHFYCDEACTIECIGIGIETHAAWDGGIVWWPLVNVAPEVYVSWQLSGQPVDANKTAYTSCKDVAQLTAYLYSAETLMTSRGHTMDDSKTKVNIYIHDKMTLSPSDYGCSYPDPAQDVWVESWDQAQTLKFHGYINLNRYDGLTGPMVEISKGGANHYNFQPGYRTAFNNNTKNNDDVCVLVTKGCLFMLENSIMTNLASESDKEHYYGIGVQLQGEATDTPDQASSVELGRDPEKGGGSAEIKKCHIAIDGQKGVVRLKAANTTKPWTVKDNYIAVNLTHNARMGKWAKDISMINSTDVLITLENPIDWHAGDWIFTSGQQRSSGLENTPLTEDDISALEFTNKDDMSQVFGIEFDKSIDNHSNYLYPLFKFAKGVILNERTQTWYTTLYDATFNPKVLDPSVDGIKDNDVLIYYGNVNEQRACDINYTLTIRSAKKNSNDENYLDTGDEPISESGYTSKFYNTKNADSFITLATGKTLTIGGTESGPFTIDLNSKGRGVYVNGNSTVNANANFTLKNGNTTGKTVLDGGGFYIANTGTVNLTAATITSNASAGKGGGVYNAGSLNVEGGILSGNASVGEGGGVYQANYMSLKGAPNLGTNKIYLCTDKVITKTGEITMTGQAYTKLQNEIDGRDILVSKVGSTISTNGKVISSDLAKMNVELSNDYTYNVVYNANGNNAGTTPKDVIELQQKLKDLIINKSGMKKGEIAVFKVKNSDNTSVHPYDFTVTVIIGADGTGSATVKDMYVQSYTVTEDQTWSWAYTPTPATRTQNIGESSTSNTFSYTNNEKTPTPRHSEANVNNKFN